MELRHEIGCCRIVHTGKTNYLTDPVCSVNLYNTNNQYSEITSSSKISFEVLPS